MFIDQSFSAPRNTSTPLKSCNNENGIKRTNEVSESADDGRYFTHLSLFLYLFIHTVVFVHPYLLYINILFSIYTK